MNKKIVLDASALLALLNQEPGHKRVEDVLPTAIMSSVNYSETLAVLTHNGVPHQEARDLTLDMLYEIVPFDSHQAFTAALLRKKTKSYGLSLGDHACLALAEHSKADVMTADKVWSKLHLDGIKIEVIR